MSRVKLPNSGLLAFLCVFVVLLTACAPTKLLERGRPDAAFERAAKRLERKSGGNRELVAALAEAYALLQADDYTILNAVRGGQRDRYGKVDPYGEQAVAILDRLLARRQRVAQLRERLKRVAYLPTWDAEPDYVAELREARADAATRLAAAAVAQVPSARNGDRNAARSAHDFLQRRRKYAADVGRYAATEAELLDLGTLRVAYETRGAGGGLEAQRRLAERLSAEWVDARDLLTVAPDWADVYAVFRASTPPGASSSSQTNTDDYSRDIETREKVGVDTSGQAIYETSVEKVSARVIEERTVYSVRAKGQVTLRLPSGDLLWRRGLSYCAIETQIDVEVSGDERALVGLCIPTGSSGWFGASDERQLQREAVSGLTRSIPRIDVDAALGQRLLATGY